MTLGISTSFSEYAVILATEGQIKFNSNNHVFEQKKNITELFDEALKISRISVKEISKIIVDIGPGGTTSVRTGVAFANSLAFSLGIAVCPVSSIELLSMTSWNRSQLPVLSLIKFMKNDYFIGFYNGKSEVQILYGELSDVLPNLLKNENSIVVTGKFQQKVVDLFPDLKITDLGIMKGDTKLLIENEAIYSQRALKFPEIAFPISEENYANNQVHF